MINLDIKKHFKSKPKNKIGLDIGSSAIKMIEISSSSERQSLVCLGVKKISSAAKEAMVETIKSLAEEIKVTTKEVNISVSGPSVIVRFVSMPKMRDDELKKAIKFEAEKYIPFAINDCIIDFQILKRNEKENKLDMLLVAAKKDFITDRISAIEESGFTVGVVDVDTFAAANAFLKNFPSIDPNKAIALINIGLSLTNVGIIRDRTLCFARDVSMNPKSSDQSSPKAAANTLLDETRLSFSYYENQSGKGIDEIYISGGGSDHATLAGLFEEAFELKPYFWDPLEFLDKSRVAIDAAILDNIKGLFAVAAGLAIR